MISGLTDMHKKNIVQALITFFLVTMPAYAHSNSEYEFHGFSEGQKYCMFETYGADSYENKTFYKIQIIDVDANQDAIQPAILTFDDTDESQSRNQLITRQKNMANATSYFQKYDFDSFYKGTLLFTNPRYGDYIHPAIKPDYDNNTFIIEKELYTLKLSQAKVNPADTDYYSQKKFTLKIVTKNKTMLLAGNKIFPRAFNYRLVSAYYCYGKIAVIIEYDTLGFEGADRKQGIITGIVKTEGLGMQYD